MKSRYVLTTVLVLAMTLMPARRYPLFLTAALVIQYFVGDGALSMKSRPTAARVGWKAEAV